MFYKHTKQLWKTAARYALRLLSTELEKEFRSSAADLLYFHYKTRIKVTSFLKKQTFHHPGYYLHTSSTAFWFTPSVCGWKEINHVALNHQRQADWHSKLLQKQTCRSSSAKNDLISGRCTSTHAGNPTFLREHTHTHRHTLKSTVTWLKDKKRETERERHDTKNRDHPKNLKLESHDLAWF